jgi:hypothetical protein
MISSSAPAVVGELVEVRLDLRRCADGRVAGHLVDLTPRRRGEDRVRLLVGEDPPAAQQRLHPRASRHLEVPLRLGGCLGRDRVHARDDVRLRQLLRRPEVAAIGRHRVPQRLGREVRCERVRETESSRELGTEQRGAEDVQGHVGPLAGDRVDTGDQRAAGQVALKLLHVLREAVRGRRVTAQRAHGGLVAARSATQSQVDPPRMERLQGAELLGDGERGVIGQHDAAGAQPDRGGVGGYVSDQHARRGRGDGAHVVVLGVPDPPVAPRLCPPGQGDAGLEAVARRGALADQRQVEDRERDGHEVRQPGPPRTCS